MLKLLPLEFVSSQKHPAFLSLKLHLAGMDLGLSLLVFIQSLLLALQRQLGFLVCLVFLQGGGAGKVELFLLASQQLTG